MQKQQPTFYPISKAPSILEITHGMLESSKEQLVNMDKVSSTPHLLNDKLINRSIKSFDRPKSNGFIRIEDGYTNLNNDQTISYEIDRVHHLKLI